MIKQTRTSKETLLKVMEDSMKKQKQSLSIETTQKEKLLGEFLSTNSPIAFNKLKILLEEGIELQYY